MAKHDRRKTSSQPKLAPRHDLVSVRRKTRKSLILWGVPQILSGEDRPDIVFFAGDLPRVDPFRDHLRDIAIMREVHRSQFQLGQVPIEKIWINPKSRDDIPAVLKGRIPDFPEQCSV